MPVVLQHMDHQHTCGIWIMIRACGIATILWNMTRAVKFSVTLHTVVL